MPIPNSENATIDIRKLRDYCLNPGHPIGKDKAKVFESALGITQKDADELKELLLSGVQTAEATVGRSDEYGQRFTVDIPIEWNGATVTIRSGWMIETGSETPRLTTCWVL